MCLAFNINYYVNRITLKNYLQYFYFSYKLIENNRK